MDAFYGKAMPWLDSNVNAKDSEWLVDSSAMGTSYPETVGSEGRPKDWHIGAIYSRPKGYTILSSV